jgi:hypothetical protein
MFETHPDLYAIEKELRGQNLEESMFLEERKKRVEPVLSNFRNWLNKRAERRFSPLYLTDTFFPVCF